MESNTTGTRNIAFGYQAYDAADTENDNLAIGYDALGGAIDGGEFNIAIGNYSFAQSGLSGTITIPASVTSIGNGAFYVCSS